MASSNVYYASDGDFEDKDQFDSLLGNTRQRRIGGNTPYRDDPVRIYLARGVDWHDMMGAYSLTRTFLYYSYRMPRRHPHPFRHKNLKRRMARICRFTNVIIILVSRVYLNMDVRPTR